MISEKTFIRYYSSFWEQLLPGIDQYVRMINAGLRERSFFLPIDTDDIPSRRAIVNAVAFKLFFYLRTERITGEDINLDSSFLLKLQESELRNLSFLNQSSDFQNPITKGELVIVKELIRRLEIYVSDKSDIEIYPEFLGCGLLFNCYGDLFYGDSLVEVKGGNSNFGRQDLYQLLTYGALNHVAGGKKDISNFELLNIRTGLHWYSDVESVCEVIGGASSAEVYSEIVGYISSNYSSI